MKARNFSLIFITSCTIVIGASASQAPALSQKARSSLRYYLENIFNDVDLSIKNHRADEYDLRKLRRFVSDVRVFEKIPIGKQQEALSGAIRKSAAQNGIAIEEIRFDDASDLPSPPIPKVLPRGKSRFRLRDHQLAGELPVRITVRADRKTVLHWTELWARDIVRIIEPRQIQTHDEGRSQILASTYFFKPIQLPKFEPQDPRSLLPAAFQQKPALLSRQAPELWTLIQNIDRLNPEAQPAYRTREEIFLLNARVHYFMSKSSG